MKDPISVHECFSNEFEFESSSWCKYDSESVRILTRSYDMYQVTKLERLFEDLENLGGEAIGTPTPTPRAITG